MKDLLKEVFGKTEDLLSNEHTRVFVDEKKDLTGIESIVDKQRQVIKVLERYGTKEAIEWLVDGKNSHGFSFGLFSPNIHKINSERDIKNVADSMCFSFEGDNYEIYFVEENTFSDKRGALKIFFNGELVLDTEYEIVLNNWGSRIELRYRLPHQYESDSSIFTLSGSTKVLKLREWIGKLPRAVNAEKVAIGAKKENEKKEGAEILERDTAKNFDLGEYS